MNNNCMKQMFVAILSILFIFVSVPVVYAENVELGEIGDYDIDQSIDLQTIKIPVFSTMSLDFSHSTFESWLSFAINIVLVLVLIFWISKIVFAGAQAMKSEQGEEMTKAWDKIRATYSGIGLTLLVPLILTIIGIFIGAGPIWAWPMAFRSCDGNSEYKYYFQALLREEDPESVCF